MNPAVWLCCFLPLLLILMEKGRRRSMRRTRRRKRKGNATMNQLIQRYLGKECIIYNDNWGGGVTGVIEAIEGNWSCVRTNKTTDLLNLDCISRIQEKPVKEKK